MGKGLLVYIWVCEARLVGFSKRAVHGLGLAIGSQFSRTWDPMTLKFSPHFTITWGDEFVGLTRGKYLIHN